MIKAYLTSHLETDLFKCELLFYFCISKFCGGFRKKCASPHYPLNIVFSKIIEEVNCKVKKKKTDLVLLYMYTEVDRSVLFNIHRPIIYKATNLYSIKMYWKDN